MNELVSYVLAVWASPVQAVIAFLILAGVVFWLYTSMSLKRRTLKDTSARLSHAEGR